MAIRIRDLSQVSSSFLIEEREEFLADEFFSKAYQEYVEARWKYPPLHSTHEGYAVIKEELDELWELVKANKGMKINNGKFVEECIQIAAMTYAFVRDLG